MIGNEILSGRTQDKNINYLANTLVECGVRLVEVRIVPDIEDDIVFAVRELKDKVDYLFTTGGIGPTHDDITAQSIAKALDRDLVKNGQAYEMLEAHYGRDEFTQPRQKMAYVPRGSKLIPNPVSVAPGFICQNVYVMAGVPEIMRMMLDHVVRTLEGGDKILSRTVPSRFPESMMAEVLAEVQERYKGQVDVGSYPYFQDGHFGVNVVLRSSESKALTQAVMEVELFISALEDNVLSDHDLELAALDTDKI